MNELIKELMPVIKQAIESGQAVAIWYILVFAIIPLLKTVINWTFVLIVLKGFYKLCLKGIDRDEK